MPGLDVSMDIVVLVEKIQTTGDVTHYCDNVLQF